MQKFYDFQDFLKLYFFYAIYSAAYGHEFSKKKQHICHSRQAMVINA